MLLRVLIQKTTILSPEPLLGRYHPVSKRVVLCGALLGLLRAVPSGSTSALGLAISSRYFVADNHLLTVVRRMYAILYDLIA